MSSPKVIVAIPACNEESRIGAVVRGCREQGVEVWVVDDGSRDATAARSREAGARVIRHEQNVGKGMAIRTALAEFVGGDADFLVFLDADGQHDPAHLPEFVRRGVETGAALVVGNRMSHAEAMPRIRRWTNRTMSWIVSRLAGREVPDSQCGFRLVTREFAQRFRPTTAHFDLESEMLVVAGREGMRVEFVEIRTIYAGESSHIRPVRDTLRFLRFLWRQRR
jgi:glycosyltransferase involved in cell wall biosynthesis